MIEPQSVGLRSTTVPSDFYHYKLIVFFLYGWSLPWCEGANLSVSNLCHFDLLKWGCASSGVLGARSRTNSGEVEG